jgi:hypothetical protein
MIIKLYPVRRDDTLQVEKLGCVLTINGEKFDFSPMTEGSTLPRSAVSCEWLNSDIEMDGGKLSLTLILPLPFNYSPDQAFPVDLVNVPDGPVAFPQPLPEPFVETNINQDASQ